MLGTNKVVVVVVVVNHSDRVLVASRKTSRAYFGTFGR